MKSGRPPVTVLFPSSAARWTAPPSRQARKAMHQNHTETRKRERGMKGWRDLPDPLPLWQRTVEGVAA